MPELQQVRAVGLERVARQPALELEVGEEVEHVVLERSRLCVEDGLSRSSRYPNPSLAVCEPSLGRISTKVPESRS
jgi:hypothetical protein